MTGEPRESTSQADAEVLTRAPIDVVAAHIGAEAIRLMSLGIRGEALGMATEAIHTRVAHLPSETIRSMTRMVLELIASTNPEVSINVPVLAEVVPLQNAEVIDVQAVSEVGAEEAAQEEDRPWATLLDMTAYQVDLEEQRKRLPQMQAYNSFIGRFCEKDSRTEQVEAFQALNTKLKNEFFDVLYVNAMAKYDWRGLKSGEKIRNRIRLEVAALAAYSEGYASRDIAKAMSPDHNKLPLVSIFRVSLPTRLGYDATQRLKDKLKELTTSAISTAAPDKQSDQSLIVQLEEPEPTLLISRPEKKPRKRTRHTLLPASQVAVRPNQAAVVHAASLRAPAVIMEDKSDLKGQIPAFSQIADRLARDMNLEGETLQGLHDLLATDKIDIPYSKRVRNAAEALKQMMSAQRLSLDDTIHHPMGRAVVHRLLEGVRGQDESRQYATLSEILNEGELREQKEREATAALEKIANKLREKNVANSGAFERAAEDARDCLRKAFPEWDPTIAEAIISRARGQVAEYNAGNAHALTTLFSISKSRSMRLSSEQQAIIRGFTIPRPNAPPMDISAIVQALQKESPDTVQEYDDESVSRQVIIILNRIARRVIHDRESEDNR